MADVTFWAFLDRNWFWCVWPALFVACVVGDCAKGERAQPGCGIQIHIDSKPTDAGVE